MQPSLIAQIHHFLNHGAILCAPRQPLDDSAGQQKRIRQLLVAARQFTGPGFVQVDRERWQLFTTADRRLTLHYGQLNPTRLLEVRLAPDGTAWLRVTHIAPPQCFKQRLYVAADRLTDGSSKASAAFSPFTERIPQRSRSRA